MSTLFIAILSAILTNLPASTTNDTPEELGKVNWLRNLEDARTLARETGKPILILFQEVPGCATCKRYGNEVLSHPLLVEAVESLFVPLAIFNNRKGPDAEVLAYYQEPSWNNPVIRIVDSDKNEVLPRLNSRYTPSSLVDYMMQALEKIDHPVPDYLSLVLEELRGGEAGLEKTTLSMYCFWTGERELGTLDGVVKTEAGFMDGREVVNVYFNPKKTSLEDVIDHGRSVRCADRIYAHDEQQALEAKKIATTKHVSVAGRFHLDKTPKYHLSQTLYRYVPMSPMQSMRVNALLGRGKKADHLLSPRQLVMLEHMYEADDPEIAVHHEHWKELFFKLWEHIGD